MSAATGKHLCVKIALYFDDVIHKSAMDSFFFSSDKQVLSLHFYSSTCCCLQFQRVAEILHFLEIKIKCMLIWKGLFPSGKVYLPICNRSCFGTVIS